MGILEDQREIIWRAIKFWMDKNSLGSPYFSLLTAGRTKEPYPPYRIARGITDGSERISSDFVHACVEVFGLASARDMSNILTDEECVGLLTAPLRETQQGELWD